MKRAPALAVLALLVPLATCRDAIAPRVAAGPGIVMVQQGPSNLLSAWITGASGPLARFGHAAATAADGRIFVSGGKTPGQFGTTYANVDVYNPATRNWGAVAALPRPLFGHTSVASNGRIYVIGGFEACGSFCGSITRSTWEYSPSDSWIPLAPLNLGRNGAAASVGPDGRIYVSGGSTLGGPTSTVEVFDPASSTWSFVAPMSLPRQNHMMATGPDGRMYAMGGIAVLPADSPCHAGNQEATWLAEVYDPKANTWSPSASMNGIRARAAAATGVDGLIYVVGGVVGGPCDGRSPSTDGSVATYDTKTAKWGFAPSLNHWRSDLAAAVGADGQLYAMQGLDPSSTATTTLESSAAPAPVTTATLASATNPSVFGQSVTFTATVTSSTGQLPGDGELIKFSDNGVPFTIKALSGGSVTLTLSTLSVGVHNISFHYSGTSTLPLSTSNDVQQTVNKSSTAVTLFITPSPTVFVNGMGASAMVAAVAPGAGAPTGTVTFSMDGVAYYEQIVQPDGFATGPHIDPPAGVHVFQATYSGDDNFLPSTSDPASHTVIRAATSTTLASSPNPSAFGQVVRLDASVSAENGQPNDGELITYLEGAAVLGTATLQAGSASLTLSTLAAGSHDITASYAGNAGLGGSASSASTQVVSQGATTATLFHTKNPSVFGEEVIYGARILAVAPAGGTPTGTVTFSRDGVVYADQAEMQNGRANGPIVNALAVGSHTFSATYSGDANFQSSTVQGTHTVNPPPNSAPIANAGGPYSGNEGATITFNAAASSDPDGDPLTYDWNFGDGTVANNAGATPSHAYADNGPFAVTVAVLDDHGHSSVASVTVGVGNASPTVSTFAGATIIQGETYSAAGTFTDPGSADTFTGSVSYGDGSVVILDLSGNAFNLSHTFTTAGTFIVVVQVSDDDGDRRASSASVIVLPANSAPVANAGGPYSGNEGAMITFDGAASSDPDGDPLTYDWDFGDGTTLSNGGTSPVHMYIDNASFIVTVTVHDDHGHSTTAPTTTVGVGNVSPTVSTFAGAQILQGQTYSASGTFTDPGADSFTGSVNWGDGSSAATGLAGGAFSLTHTYPTAGTYNVTVSITDDDGGTGTSSATVTVLSPAGGTQVLGGTVQTLLTSGAITGQTASQLMTSLNAAVASLAAGNTTAANGQIGSFINKVQAGMNSGKISAADGAALIAFAQQVLNSI